MRVFIMCLFLLLMVASAFAVLETRGLRVVAKDQVNNQSGEVKLYNKSYAVIIGIDRYQNMPTRSLSYAVNDAEGVLATIRKHYKFDRIATLYNQEATKERIMKLLTSELPKDMGSDDAVFIFWAGHGNQENSAEGEIGYLIPYDGSTDEIYKNITMTEIRDTVSKKLPAKHVFYAFDACYSGLLATRSVDTKSRRDLAYMKEITKERVRQVLTAGSKGQEVLDGGRNGHSVFTGRLIELLEAQGDYITANEIQAIIKEKVYGDAIGRGLNQRPDFGRLSGTGDFVFIPNIEQKLQGNKAELTKIEAELKQYEKQEAEAKQHQSEQQQREAEQKRKAAEARLKAEQLRQQQLGEEAKRQQEMVAERARFEAEQQRREQELSAAQKGEEQRLAALKAELAKKKQSAPTASTGTLTAAIAEIRRLNAEIEAVETAFSRELTDGKNRITTRYDSEIAAVKQASSRKQAPLQRDEFETETEFKARTATQQSTYSERINELQSRKQSEIADLECRLSREQQTQTADLRQNLKTLSDKQFTVGAETVAIELGTYNADKQHFPVTFTSKSQLIKIAMNGTLPLPRDTARSFKQQYQAGAIRPQVNIQAGGGNIVKIALTNDSDNSIYEYSEGEFMTVAERKRREVAAAAERKRLIYTNPQSGLMWTRKGNIDDKWMSWNDAMNWVKNLSYAGYSDWRLPTKEELETFAKRGGKRPSTWFNANGFNGVQANYYWSSTTYAVYAGSAWIVSMGDGSTGVINKTDYGYVWLVRGGQ